MQHSDKWFSFLHALQYFSLGTIFLAVHRSCLHVSPGGILYYSSFSWLVVAAEHDPPIVLYAKKKQAK